MKERNEIEEKYKWDLTSLFKNDEAFEQCLNSLKGKTEEAKAFEGTLNNAENILKFLNWKRETQRLFLDCYCYATLKVSEDTRNAKASSMMNRCYGIVASVSAATSFADPEILSLDETVLKNIINDERLKEYQFALSDLVRQKPYVLSAKEERVLSSLQDALNTSSEASSKLMNADMIYDDAVDGEGKSHPLSSSAFIGYEFSDDRSLRKSAFENLYKSYKQHIHTLAATYAGCVKAECAIADLRGYNSSREMHMFTDNIPVKVYDNLVETIHKHMDLMYRYLKLRKEILKVDELHFYDVYAPLSKGSTKKYTYEDAQQMVLDAVKPFGTDYVNIVKSAFRNRWIDVYPNAGKRSGAFSYGTYDSNPVIMLNFNETLDSVSTLAHEMGHSMHSYLTHKTQPRQYGNYTMFVAEVASTVNENLLIDQLLSKCTEPKERLALLNEYLEGFKGTVYRQTMFAEFEMIAHKMQENGESLDADSLCKVYEDLIKLYFGDEMVIDDEIRYEWARIPHFYTPFYVYVYATGYTSATALSQGILKDGQKAVDKYLEFLSMGSSRYPLDELKHAGVDLDTPEPIERALKKFEQILDDAEQTIKLIK